MSSREQIIEQAVRASWAYYWEGDPIDDADADTRNEFTESVAATLPVITRAITDRIRPLVADWQANGNSRELGDPSDTAWFKAARDLLTLLDAIDAEMGAQR